jgi:hypothetical protein
VKRLGYLGFSTIFGAVLSLAVISGCNSEEAPPATPPATPSAEPAGGPKMEEPTPKPEAAPAPKPEEKK